MQLKSSFRMHKVSYLLLAVTLAVVVALLAAPAFSASTNQCSSCHGTKYTQQLDIVEGSSQNKIPTALQVGQTQTVTVAVSNINNAALNNQFTGVSLTLSSQSGHFTVASPTVNIGTLATGTTTATWQITGTSQGSDALVISASATNTHNNLKFSDSYSPTPTINVAAAATSTPAPTPVPTVAPTPVPTVTVGPIATATPPPSTTPTTSPTSNPTAPTTQSPTPTASPQPNQTSNPTDTSNSTQPTSTPAPVDQPSQDVTVSPSTSDGSTGTLTIVAPEGTHISWETSTQELNLSPSGATQPLTVNLQYATTDGTNPLSANTLALSWTAVGGIAPLKTTLEYQSFDGSWNIVAQNILGGGSYTWTLPDTAVTFADTVKMRVTMSDSSAAAQTVSATANIDVSQAPKHSAVSQSIMYNQIFGLSVGMIAMAFYVRRLRTKRASMSTIPKAFGGLKR